MVAPGCDGCQVSSLPGSPRKRNKLSHETSFSHFRGAPAHIKSHCLLQQRTGFSDFTTLLLALPAAESSTSAATLKSNLSKPWSHPHTPTQVSLLQHLQLKTSPSLPCSNCSTARVSNSLCQQQHPFPRVPHCANLNRRNFGTRLIGGISQRISPAYPYLPSFSPSDCNYPPNAFSNCFF